LRDEYTRTISPARARAAETLTLERTLSDLGNQAYALTPAEIALMWQTAPPRLCACGMWTCCAAPCARTPLRVIAVIDASRVVERILRHLGVCHDPPPRPPPHAACRGFSRVGREGDFGGRTGNRK
jgi:hypothetical protein